MKEFCNEHMYTYCLDSTFITYVLSHLFLILLSFFNLILVFFFLFFKLKKRLSYIGAYLVNNVVLVSGVQQSDSVIHVSILFQILSNLGYHRILSSVPVLYRRSLVIYFFNLFI